MTGTGTGVQIQESYVSGRFDLLQTRFKREVARDDFRYAALVRRLEPLGGRRVLDLGCGKGRFARRLCARGADVLGVDLSQAMLREAEGIDRVRGSGRRLPFADSSFDSVIAVEVLQHVTAIGEVLDEVLRVLRPGGCFLVIDKNAGSFSESRPYMPNLALKWLDEKRGRWMYPSDSPVRERWFWPGALRTMLAQRFAEVEVDYLLSRAEAARWLFRFVPLARQMALWVARRDGRDP